MIERAEMKLRLDQVVIQQGRLADAEPVETVEGVGAELDAGADLAQAARFLQHLRGDALLGERQRCRQSADAAAGDENPIWGHR